MTPAPRFVPFPSARALCAFVLCAALSGCSSNSSDDSANVEEDEVHGRYALTYDAARPQAGVRAFAQFRFGGRNGTTLRLSKPSTVTIDGVVLTLRDGDKNPVNLTGSFYDSSLPDAPKVKGSYVFTWTRTDGEVARNEIPAFKAAKPSMPLNATGKASRAEALQVTFEGEALSPGESITCSLTSKAKASEGEKSSLTESLNGVSTCIFSASNLRTFAKGKADVVIRREWSSTKVSGHDFEGGSLSSRYESAAVEIEITD